MRSCNRVVGLSDDVLLHGATAFARDDAAGHLVAVDGQVSVIDRE